MNVEELKAKIRKKIVSFGFNKGPLNLNNSCITNNQFYKLLN
jgi:hypothetical protein